jgi:cytochrome bd ubiquinol oxidase subunit I
VLAPLQLFIGDAHGLNTAKHQPAKVAAMEAHWDGSKPADLILFAWPDDKAETNHFEIAIPNLASFIITHQMDGLFKGLKDFAPHDRPPIKPVFFAFRVMVGLGMLMIAGGLLGAFLWWRGKLFDTRWYLTAVSYAWPTGFVAILAGWWVTETGRQPWLVHGILRTADAASPVSGGAVLTTLILFIAVYSVVFSMGIYYINRLIEKGPAGAAVKPSEGLPSRPLSAAEEAAHEAIEGTK